MHNPTNLALNNPVDYGFLAPGASEFATGCELLGATLESGCATASRGPRAA
jgi:hypothetical protein